MMTSMFARANLVVGILFLVSALLQLNDPDPVPWIAIYAAAALASFLYNRSRASRPIAIVVLAISIVWAGVLVPIAVPDFRFGALFETMKAESPVVETSREMLGLLIISTWMAVLLYRPSKRFSGNDE